MPAVNPVQSSRNTAGSSGEQGYIVKPGDNLSQIARNHGVSLAAVERANPQILHPDLIRPGQHVTLPSSASAGGDSYTVQPGDTLSGIGARFGVSWQAIASANHIANPNLIHPGDHLDIPAAGTGGAGGVSGNTPSGMQGGGTGNVAQIAEKYLGQDASALKTNRGDALPMNPNVPSDVCCANFVSAVLTEAGQLPGNLHTDSVAQLNSTLRSRGWTPVSASEAKPGDVVIIQGGGVSHTEIVSGKGQMIGSNNINADGTQEISHNNLSWALQHGGVILRAPGGTNNGTPSTGGTQAPSGTTPSGNGDRNAKIDQAITYFEGQGWSRAQAIGLNMAKSSVRLLG